MSDNKKPTMATITARINSLEKELSSIKDNELLEIKVLLKTLAENTKQIESGLYGDKENKYRGLIDRVSYLEDEIGNLKNQITNIKDKDREQDLNISVKRTFKQEIIEFTKETVKLIAQIVGIYLALKTLNTPINKTTYNNSSIQIELVEWLS